MEGIGGTREKSQKVDPLESCIHSLLLILLEMRSATLNVLSSCSRSASLRSLPHLRPLPLPRLIPSSLSSISPLPRLFSTSTLRYEAAPSTGTPIGRIERKLRIIFTCTAPVPLDPQQSQAGAPAKACGHRSSHEFSKRSYEKGVVIVQCPECSNRHLIGKVFLLYPLALASSIQTIC